MTARLTVAERVARLDDLSPAQMLDLLIRLDAKSPRAMDDAIEYMLAATVVRAEIADEPERDPRGVMRCCDTAMPWPERGQELACPDCGTTWEHDGVTIGAGARIKSQPEAAAAAPPRAGEDQELCGAQEPSTGKPFRRNCNAAKDHGGTQHAARAADGMLLSAWPARVADCNSINGIYLCTLPGGHDGSHVHADRQGFIKSTWPAASRSLPFRPPAGPAVAAGAPGLAAVPDDAEAGAR